jgi:hypothetical protein
MNEFRQHKQRVCNDETIQIKWMCWTARWQQQWHWKQAIKRWKRHQMNLQKGAGGRKFQLGCAISKEHSQQFQGQELAPSSKLCLIGSRLDWKLWIVSAKRVKTNLEWIWASSYSWTTDLDWFPVDFSRNPTGDLLKSSTWWGGPWGWCGPALVMIWAIIAEEKCRN